ncbi:putative spore germination protein GerPE [Paraliobacillus sp. PM-2]|uniref:spore germination protein GerPE n=1 Tax=Paraliobacillus sp. PM-2 TaxID=1462524 RepID=UPI00061C1D20|nr:spore germination protein GerPE [Paraliobacillus sp. PM-2]CQR47013.1 putative spore germination protein GerPE [Paraliobacillus sp. PM-2]
MTPRTSKVKLTRINNIVNSSIFEIGDASILKPRTNIIAIQKEGGVESDKGYSFSNYPLFSKTLPSIPKTTIQKSTINHDHAIHVDAIDITGVTASSTVQLGSLDTIEAESRLKHIRILLSDEQLNEQ